MILCIIGFIIFFVLLAMLLIGYFAHREHLRIHLKDGRIMLSHKDEKE